MMFWFLMFAISVAIILLCAWIGIWCYARYLFVSRACLRHPNKEPSPEQMEAMLAEWHRMWRSREGLRMIFKNCGWIGFKASLIVSLPSVALMLCAAVVIRKIMFFS